VATPPRWIPGDLLQSRRTSVELPGEPGQSKSTGEDREPGLDQHYQRRREDHPDDKREGIAQVGVACNGGFGPNQTVTLSSGWFESRDCGTWEKIG
jgi:hypothetical protein